jgi:hypothetical protein
VLAAILTTSITTVTSIHGIALADPAHCDQPGWPSCYSVGYADGQNHGGTTCSSGHSNNFCAGWDAGSHSVCTGGLRHSRCDQVGFPSCQDMGYNDGTAAGQGDENNCGIGMHSEPSAHHSSAYLQGFHNGYRDELSRDQSDDGTYGNCGSHS